MGSSRKNCVDYMLWRDVFVLTMRKKGIFCLLLGKNALKSNVYHCKVVNKLVNLTYIDF
jgi:hypothetical protein